MFNGGPDLVPPRTSPLAVVGLVLAFLISPVGLVISIVALVRQRRGTHGGRGLAIGGVVVGVLGTVVWALIAALVVFGTWTIDEEQVETQLADTTQQIVGVRPTSVTCPDDVRFEQGGVFTCTAELEGKQLRYTVTQVDDKGQLKFIGSGWKVTAKAEEFVVAAAERAYPGMRFEATCANGDKVVLGEAGTTFPCTVNPVGAPSAARELTLRIANNPIGFEIA